jgi:hypothetical protein
MVICIPIHLQKAAEVMLLVVVWMHAQADALWAADICSGGSGRVITKIP